MINYIEISHYVVNCLINRNSCKSANLNQQWNRCYATNISKLYKNFFAKGQRWVNLVFFINSFPPCRLSKVSLNKILKFYLQKQPPRGVLRKRCFGNMQQIYRRTHMPKITLWHWYSPVNLRHIFRTPFPKNTAGRLLLYLM